VLARAAGAVETDHAIRALRCVIHGFALLPAANAFQWGTDPDESFAWMIRFVDAGLRAAGMTIAIWILFLPLIAEWVMGADHPVDRAHDAAVHQVHRLLPGDRAARLRPRPPRQQAPASRYARNQHPF
jgi:hypothetical protein